jgi:large subunit ribosomal protein L25
MEKVALTAGLRQTGGKGVARSLRRQGQIPAVIYSAGTSTLLSMNALELRKKVGTRRREGILVSLQVEGSGEKTAILKDMQWDPVGGDLLHVDLFEVAMDKPIRVKVPLKLSGNPQGVKDGGILQFILREVAIECLPTLIPDHLMVDALTLGIGEHLYVKELSLPEGIRLLEEGDHAILSIAAPVSEAKLTELLTAAPTETGKEPELVKKPVKEEPAVEGTTEGKF